MLSKTKFREKSETESDVFWIQNLVYIFWYNFDKVM